MRQLIIFWILIGSTLLTGGCVHGPLKDSAKGGYPIMQGPTSISKTHISVLRPTEEGLKYQVKSGEKTYDITPQSENLKHHSLTLDYLTITAQDQSPHSLLISDGEGRLKDKREFGFLDPQKESVRMLIASCMDDHFTELQERMWDQAHQTDSDLMLFIGDNVYADSGPEGALEVSEKVLETRYVETRQRLKIYRQPRLTPIFSTWDDHDYGQNNGDRNFKLKTVSSQLFSKFFSQAQIDGFYENGPGISSKINFAHFEVMLLDNRSFRSPNNSKNPGETHFGSDQETWIFKGLKPQKLTFLASGDQWFGGYHRFESYQGNHPQSFKRFTQRLKNKKAKAFFLSGDRHLVELMKVPAQWIGRETFELTSSGVHARMYPGAFEREPNPLQLLGADGVANYVVVEVPNKGPVQSLNVKAEGENKAILFEKDLQL